MMQHKKDFFAPRDESALLNLAYPRQFDEILPFSTCLLVKKSPDFSTVVEAIAGKLT